MAVEFPAGHRGHEARRLVAPGVADGSRIASSRARRCSTVAPSRIDHCRRTLDASPPWLAKPGRVLVWRGHRPAPKSGLPRAPTATCPQLHAVSLRASSGRYIARARLARLHDVFATGRVLLSRYTIRISIACQPPDETRERDLTWQLASSVKGLTSDGETLIFEDELLSAPPLLYRRGMDGSPAVPIGSGSSATLSPDGKWVLASTGSNLVLLPTGAGDKVTLPTGDVVPIGDVGWLGNSKRIVFTGRSGSGTPRGYIQDLPEGMPRAITPPGVVLAGRAAARDDHSILGRVGASWTLFPIGGGTPGRFER